MSRRFVSSGGRLRKEAMMRVEVNRDTCIGHGVCEGVAPEVFKVDEDGALVLLIDGDIPEPLLPKVRKAVFNCPEHALRLVKTG
jgi:ferredoxin